MPAFLAAKAGHNRTPRLNNRQRASGHVPEPRRTKHGVLQYTPSCHSQFIGDAAGCADFACFACQLSSETLCHPKVARHSNQAVRHRLVRFVNRNSLIIGEASATLPTVENESSVIGWPGYVQGGSHGPALIQHANGRREHGEPIHEVGGAIQWIQHPENVLGQFLRLLLFFGTLFAQNAVIREAFAYLGHQIFLGSFVGSGYWVTLMIVFELDVDLPSEVLHQDTPGASGNLNSMPFNLFGQGVIPKLQNTTIWA